MVPSGGLHPAKMAPAGAQMGSGNLINAGIVKKGGREAERGGATIQRAREQIQRSEVWRTDGWMDEGEKESKPEGAFEKPAADLIHLAGREEETDQQAGVLELKNPNTSFNQKCVCVCHLEERGQHP